MTLELAWMTRPPQLVRRPAHFCPNKGIHRTKSWTVIRVLYENLMSHFIIHNEIWQVSRDLHPRNVTMLGSNTSPERFTQCPKRVTISITPRSDDSYYRKISNIRRTLVGNNIVDHSDVVGASPVGAAPTTSSFSTWHVASMDWAKTTVRRDGKRLCLGIWCVLY